MRLVLTLESACDYAYDLRYHAKLQGFVYSLLRGTPYEHLHDLRGYKYFCFSNIYPPFDARQGEKRYLVLSSPDEELVRTFAQALLRREEVGVGNMRFYLKEIRVVRPRIGKSVALVTRTPIIVRIPRRSYARYGITSEHSYVYWRPSMPFDAFLRQLEDNLMKKYRSFLGRELEEGHYLPLFQQFVFKKQVCNHLLIKNCEVRVFGSLWEFHFPHLRREQRELLRFAIDAGFGERNSLGFGFMEVKVR
ncbi:MAG: CRISPR-associated endoribonuclease Cas6 [Euryarchaeota archaeon]|nr:CRISPR-associated endoribonuclease Cas6 [Euryarchaeota archaeon]